MIRTVLLLLALVAGLGAAVLSQGRLYHLRALAPDRVPAWAGRLLAEDAGLLQGALRPGAAGVPGAVLSWRAAMPGLDGMRWRLELTGGGADLEATVLLPWSLRRAEISGIAGSVDIAPLAPAGVDAAGLVRVLSGAALVTPLPSAGQVSGTIDARIAGAALDGTALGDGTLSASMAPLGSWRARFALDGGALEVAGEATGRLGRDSAALTLDLVETPDTPEAWKNALAVAGRRTETGWRVETVIPVPAALPARN